MAAVNKIRKKISNIYRNLKRSPVIVPVEWIDQDAPDHNGDVGRVPGRLHRRRRNLSFVL